MAKRHVFAAALLLALTWLLPNHYPPWLAFYKDFYCAAIIWLVVMAGTATSRPLDGNIGKTGPIILLSIGTLPLIQFAVGIIPFIGQALISFTYLTGFFLAIILGAQLEKSNRNLIVDILFGGVLIASVVSVYIQLSTWLGISSDSYADIFILSHTGSRPAANLGQANQLAMLHCLGLIACVWFLLRKLFGIYTCLILIVFISLGIALTQSRVGMLIVVFLASAGALGAIKFHDKRVALLLFSLPFVLFLSYSGGEFLSKFYFSPEEEVFGARGRESISLRLEIWKLFFAAAIKSPWLGFGLTDLGWVQILESHESQRWGTVFLHSHNIGLELVLWLGLPVASVVAIGFTIWLCRSILAISDLGTLAVCLAVFSLLIHASVELPLHYAYFLLPFGLLLGSLDARTSKLLSSGSSFSFRYSSLLLFLCIPLLVVIYRDYSIVDEEYRQARFSAANFTYVPPDQSARILVLDHARDYVRLVRLKPEDVLQPGELKRLNLAALHFGSVGVFYNLAIINDRAGHPEEAAALIRHGCVIATEEICSVLRSEFTRMTVSTPPIN